MPFKSRLKRREYYRQYYKKHRDQILQQKVDYYHHLTPQQKLDRYTVTKQWRKDNPQRMKQLFQRTKVRTEVKSQEINEKYKNKPCQDCGQRFLPCALDFHHRTGTDKRGSISSLMKSPMEVIVAEIQKCDLLCAVCHRIRHHEIYWAKKLRKQIQESLKHGRKTRNKIHKK